MLEVVNVAGVARQGEAKMDYASAYQGYIAYIKGVATDGTVLLSCPNSSAQAAKSYYPVKKLRFEEDLSDTSTAVDLIKKNDRVVYYEGGEFITNHFSRNSLAFGRVVPGPTAAGRGGYGAELVVTTVSPLTPLYVIYWGSRRGMLTATAVGTAMGYASAAPVYGRGGPAPNFRLVQAWISSAEANLIPNISIRFKAIPAYTGMKY